MYSIRKHAHGLKKNQTHEWYPGVIRHTEKCYGNKEEKNHPERHCVYVRRIIKFVSGYHDGTKKKK